MTYRITSDIEQRLLDEMNGYTVQGFVKKKQLVTAYKASNFTHNISRVQDNGLQYDFYITTDNDDELTSPNLKYLKLKIKSIYNISDDRLTDIDTLKVQHQNDKDLLWLVPDNIYFKELDRLIDEVERINYLEQKYNNPNSEEGKILVSFTSAKSEKQNRIKDIVEESLLNSTAVYLYNTLQMNKDNWQSTLQTQQKQIIQNVYSKRLASQMSDSTAAAIVSEANNNRLHQYFPSNEFKFFDNNGNFIGEKLRVTEEILYKIRNTFVDGKTIEKDLEEPPTGYTFGTVISAMAALLRAGKVIAKHNGNDLFSWRDNGVKQIFDAATRFRSASFKAVSKSLSAIQKQNLAQFLLDLEAEKYIGRKVDYNTNDYELVSAIRDVAKHFADKVGTLRNSEKEFDYLFPGADKDAQLLGEYTGAVSEANYIDKAVEFLETKAGFLKAIQDIEKVEKFIRNNLPKAKEWKAFAEAVLDELYKVAANNTSIINLHTDFEALYTGDIVKNYSLLQQITQKIKDEYHSLFSAVMKDCSKKYTQLVELSNQLILEINALPEGLNESALSRVKTLNQYASQRIQASVVLDFDVKDKQSRFTYSEILSFIELYHSKKTEIEIIKAGLLKEKEPESKTENNKTQVVKKYAVKIPALKMKVSDYKIWLHGELQKLAGASDSDEIEINS